MSIRITTLSAPPRPTSFFLANYPNMPDPEKVRYREMELRKDPFICILSRDQVQCRQCGRKIKLSSNSAFDPSHWRQHRRRCDRRYREQGRWGGPWPIENQTFSGLTSRNTRNVSSSRSGSSPPTPPIISTPDSSLLPQSSALAVSTKSPLVGPSKPIATDRCKPHSKMDIKNLID